MLQKQRSSSTEERSDDQCYVRNSSFLSRDIEAQKGVERKIGKETPSKAASPPKTGSPAKVVSPPRKVVSPPTKVVSPSTKVVSPPTKVVSPPSRVVSPPSKVVSPPKRESAPPKSVTPSKQSVTSPPPVSATKTSRPDVKLDENSVAAKASKIEAAAQSNKEVTSPPVTMVKFNRTNSKDNSAPPKVPKRENSLGKEMPVNTELSVAAENSNVLSNVKSDTSDASPKVGGNANKANDKETVGVGDKIKKFEKAAEDASANVGKLSRPGSVRGRSRTERLGSDSKDDFPPPATPFKDNVHFELGPLEKSDKVYSERQQNITKTTSSNVAMTTAKWQRSESHEEKVIQKPEPQKIIKPEFKPMPSPVDVTIRSPSLGAKIPDQFPSHGTAFRNVASPDQARNVHKFNEDLNTQNNLKPCKLKNKEKYCVSKGSSYFTRGSEEIWLVKKKDIEEIEERVLDSFRRAGGNVCMRSESMRPSSDSGQGASFTHATMGRNKRQMYARSESLDPQWAGARAQTLKRQTSVACTCGHDKKTRAKSAEATARPRSRSHGDDNNQAHVLDKYETLV